jgi:hypothetical protein
LDTVHSRLFWSDSLGGRILARDLTGGPLAVILDLPSSFDGALDVDPFQGHVYFTTGSFIAGTAKIERVNFDGSDRRVIANTYAASMGLDLVNERVYAADWDAHRIRRVNFDGTELTTIIPRVIAPRDVQVFGDKLYFPNILSEAPDGTAPYHFQWVRTTLDGANSDVLWQVPRLEGPHDMIQFAVVVPEPGGAVIAILLGTTMVSRRKRRCSATINSAPTYAARYGISTGQTVQSTCGQATNCCARGGGGRSGASRRSEIVGWPRSKRSGIGATGIFIVRKCRPRSSPIQPPLWRPLSNER